MYPSPGHTFRGKFPELVGGTLGQEKGAERVRCPLQSAQHQDADSLKV